MSCLRHDTDVAGLVAFFACVALKSHALIFRQALEAIGLDVAKVCEQILAAVIGSNEAEAFGVVEPFHGAGLSLQENSIRK